MLFFLFFLMIFFHGLLLSLIHICCSFSPQRLAQSTIVNLCLAIFPPLHCCPFRVSCQEFLCRKVPSHPYENVPFRMSVSNLIHSCLSIIDDILVHINIFPAHCPEHYVMLNAKLIEPAITCTNIFYTKI